MPNKRRFDRKARVADLIQKALATIIMKEMPDAKFRFVTITDVEMSRDLSYAKVFVSVLQDDAAKIKEIIADLNNNVKPIRYSLAQSVKLRIVPEIKFMYDESTAHGFKISGLIDRAMKKTEK